MNHFINGQQLSQNPPSKPKKNQAPFCNENCGLTPCELNFQRKISGNFCQDTLNKG